MTLISKETEAPAPNSPTVEAGDARAFGPDHARWLEEQRAEQAKRWAVVAVVVGNDHEGIVLNYGGFGDYAFDGVGSWCSDEGLAVPKLPVGLYYVSHIGINADEDDFEAWGTWTLAAPLDQLLQTMSAALQQEDSSHG